MKKLDFNDYLICKLQGKVFESSIIKTNTSSPIFIRRFMNSIIATSFDDKSILISPVDTNDIFNSIEEEFGKSIYGSIKFNEEIMYWVGYFYRVLSFYFNLSSKATFKLFKLDTIINYYNIGHTFDPEEAATRLQESLGYDFDYTDRGLKILKHLTELHKLEKLLGQNIKVVINQQIGSSSNDITLNYGYTQDLKTSEDKFLEAYILGIKKEISIFEGKLIAIINVQNEFNNKLVLCDKNKNYTTDEIKNLIKINEDKFNIIR